MTSEYYPSLNEPKEGDLHVWFTPNPPREAFTVPVSNLEVAQVVYDALAFYSLYLGEDMIPVSAGGVCRFEDGEWCDAEDENGDYVVEAWR